MQIKILLFFLLMLLLLVSLPSTAADSYRPAAFIFEEIGARSTGLGGATTALLDDVTSLYSNPAGLTGVDQYQTFFDLGNTHSRDLFGSFALAIPFQRRTTVAIAYSGLKLDDRYSIPVLGNDNNYHTKQYIKSEMQDIAEIGFGRIIGRGLSIGASARYTKTASTDPFANYDGLFGNIGIRYNSAVKGMVFAATVKNLGGKLKGSADPDIPISVSAGFSFGKLLSSINYANFAVEGIATEKHDLAVRAGAEYWWANYLGLRLGYDGLAREKTGNSYGGTFRGGISVNFREMLIDLAAVPARNGLRNSRLEASIRMVFGEGRRR
ncbi:MAG: hypothetical protein AUJ18_03840 [Candidatus Hydrogenedentes bacterium CG1_02_42_14]|nr:MAG: hypothetical protein AUJ18_03840 [Candidatus Hydrogenedentes bacterium CG1_02_42_14]